MRGPLSLIAAAVAAVLLLLSVYTLSETEQAILTQFGEPVGGLVTKSGLHFKAPLVQIVHTFDRGGSSSRDPRTRFRPRTRNTSLSGPSPAGGSSIR